MRKGVEEIAVMVALLAGAAGCSDGGCTNRSANYKLHGIAPESATCSSMMLVFYEDHTDTCAGGNTLESSAPGGEVLAHAITPATSYDVVVPVHYTSLSNPPSVDVQLFCDENSNGTVEDTCLGSTTLPPADDSDVTITQGASCARL
jgi:hypothetical protein